MNNTDEITLKELILKIIEFKNEILRNWKWVLLMGGLLAAYMFYSTLQKPVYYEAELTFMVSEDEGGEMGGMAGLLGQFGFRGNSGKSNPEKMLELLMTRNITEKALFCKAIINEEQDYLANHLISNLEQNKMWAYKPWYKRWIEKPSELYGFRFTTDSIPSFSRLDNSALKKLHKYLTGEAKQIKTSVSEMSGIMKMSIQTTEEDLSIQILRKLYQELSNYYYTKTVEKTETNYKLIKAKVDSLYHLLSTKEYQLAKFKDSNKGLITQIGQLQESRLFRDIQKLTLMYGEASKNLEIAEFSFNLKKPYIQGIDFPIVPLKRIGSSKIKGIITGAVLGFFLTIFFIILRKIFRDALK